jgi:hypothetical protein
MLDLAQTWPRIPDWRDITDVSPGLRLATIEGLGQYLVSGNLAPFGEGIGAFGMAAADRAVLRVARDRILAINPDPALVTAGWHADGFAMTDVSAMYHVFEFAGPGLGDLIGEAVLIDPENGGPSASTMFAGLPAFIYWQAEGRLRVHVERVHATHLFSWLQSRN